jgi:dipeptide/tripeptide permease
MIVSSVPGIIDKPKLSTGVFSLSLVVMGIGTGGFKANISPLVAEQYAITKPFVRTLRSGEKVVVDPILTTSTIYMVSPSLAHIFLIIQIYTTVLLSLHQPWCSNRPNRNDLRGEGFFIAAHSSSH